MSRRRQFLVYVLLIVGVPAGVAAGWWAYWPTYEVRRAEAALAAGEYQRAFDIATPLAAGESPSPRALLAAGTAARRLRRAAVAEELLTRADRLGADKAAVRRELALVRAETRFGPAVETALLETLEARPDDAEVLAALARGCAEGLRWADAERYFTRAVDLRPDDFALRLDRGHLRLTAARESPVTTVAAAAGDFAELVRRDPGHYEARLYLAQCLLSDAKPREAQEHLRACHRLAPGRPEPLVGLASCALEERDWDGADRLLREATARDPGSVPAAVMQGDLGLRRERYEDAVRGFRRAVELDPANAPARLKLAQALRGLKQDAEADAEMKVYEKLAKPAGR